MIKAPQEFIEKYGWYSEPIDPNSPRPRDGSIKTVSIEMDEEEFNVLMRFNGFEWVVAGSELDVNLTTTKKGGKLQGMAKIPELIPEADKLFDEGFNVLLIGLHGTGKTVSIQDMVDRRGLKMKYFSCSTLDPFTDLVGVPVPRDVIDENGEVVLDSHGAAKQELIMARPRDVDEAEIIFFDELNRADAKTLNAVFEIIQFKSINGEPLPNLKVCWAAINPPDENYDVDRLDEALLDRFDLYIKIDAQPSVSYMSQFMAPQYAKAIYKWWSGHNVEIRKKEKDAKMDYISPRRLVKIGKIWEAFGNARMVQMALPQGGNFDKGKLVDLLRAAQKNIEAGRDGDVPEEGSLADDGTLAGDAALGQKPYDGFQYNAGWLRANQDEVVEFLEKHPNHYETHTEIIDVLKVKIGGEGLVSMYSPTLNALDPKLLEGMLSGFNASKVSFMRAAFNKEKDKDATFEANSPNLRTALGGDKFFA